MSFGLAFVEKQKQKAVCIYAKSLQLCPILCDPMDGSLCNPMDGSPGLLCSRVSPGKNTGVACHSLLQGIFLTQELKPALPHCRRILYHLSYYYRYDWIVCFMLHQGYPDTWRKFHFIVSKKASYPTIRFYSTALNICCFRGVSHFLNENAWYHLMPMTQNSLLLKCLCLWEGNVGCSVSVVS